MRPGALASRKDWTCGGGGWVCIPRSCCCWWWGCRHLAWRVACAGEGRNAVAEDWGQCRFTPRPLQRPPLEQSCITRPLGHPPVRPPACLPGARPGWGQNDVRPAPPLLFLPPCAGPPAGQCGCHRGLPAGAVCTGAGRGVGQGALPPHAPGVHVARLVTRHARGPEAEPPGSWPCCRAACRHCGLLGRGVCGGRGRV